MGLHNDEITMQCPQCQKMVETYISHILEDKSFACPYCLSNNPVNTEKFSTGIKILTKEIAKLRSQRVIPKSDAKTGKTKNCGT